MNVVEEGLASIASEEDLAARGHAITETWRSLAVDGSAVRPILVFMEQHSNWDLGSPGPLVHFAEQFFSPVYVQELVASVGRKATAHTLWMLNRVINGETDSERRKQLINLMAQIASTPGVNPEVANEARDFAAFHEQQK